MTSPQVSEERARFLKEFVKAAIINSSSKVDKQSQNFQKSIPMVNPDFISLESRIIKIKEIDSVPQIQPAQIQIPDKNLSTDTQGPAQNLNQKSREDWGKLTAFMYDDSIETIECPGPDKPLIILSKGKPMNISLSLTKENIDYILKKIMRETHKSEESNFLRAETQFYEITAVISEFVGSRFIINKR